MTEEQSESYDRDAEHEVSEPDETPQPVENAPVETPDEAATHHEPVNPGAPAEPAEGTNTPPDQQGPADDNS